MTQKKTWFCVLAGYPVDIQKKIYDDFLYMNTHYFYFINQTLSLKIKAHFEAISFQKDVVLYKKGCKKGSSVCQVFWETRFSPSLIKIELHFFLYRFLSYMSIYSINICPSVYHSFATCHPCIFISSREKLDIIFLLQLIESKVIYKYECII